MKPNRSYNIARHSCLHGLYLTLALLIGFMCGSCGKQTDRIVILTSGHTFGQEIDSLVRMIDRDGRAITVADINSLTPASLSGATAVIYHRSDSSAVSDDELKLADLLIPYVREGGSLLLTMEATRLLNLWGIEPEPLDVDYQDATDYGFGRAVGFHGYREHPVFENLSGGAYVWKSHDDHQARTLGFSGKNVPLAPGSKVIGINWAYIHYHENRKLIWETPVGDGQILAIGAYLHYSLPNANRSTLRIFTDNVVDYLCGSRRFESRPMHWVYDTLMTQAADFPTHRITLAEEEQWRPSPSRLCGTRTADKRHFWNVSGEQALVMGRELGNIEEIWIHPVMALRDLTVGLKLRDNKDIVWLDTVASTVTRCPHYIERRYPVSGNGSFSEVLTVSPTEPVIAVNYSWDNPQIENVYVAYTSNLRLMWPYSLTATGTLFYASDRNGALTAVCDRNRQLNMMAAFDREPSSFRSGMVDFSHRNIAAFDSIPAKNKQVTFLHGFSAQPGKLNLLLSGGEQGTDRSAKLLQASAGHTKAIYDQAESHFNKIGEGLLSIESSDTAFNRAYEWALVSTDKFFCHTPSIGKSLMAGYWTTSRGWNGGHTVSGRPGYAWYFGRDTEWTATAMNSYGDHGKVRDILTTFGRRQDPDGKVYHEMTTSGSVHYDASDATPLYLVLAGDYLRKTADTGFIRSQWPNLMKALSFCLSTDTDNDGLIENTGVGHGWQEGHQLHGAHTEVYLAAIWTQALKECACMADELGHKDVASDCNSRMERCRRIINEKFWNDSLQFFNHGLMKDGSFQTEKCVLGGTPVLFGLADGEKALATASNFSDKYYSTDWGVRMVGYDSPYFALGGYAYGNIWPFHTGCAALAEYKAGLRSQGFRHAYSSLRLFATWDYGNIAEVILGDRLSFTGICPHQQWSSGMNLRPLFDGMLGLEVDALADSMALAPAFPADWEYAHVKHIPMAGKRLSLDYDRKASEYVYDLRTENNSPVNLTFSPVLPLATCVECVTLDGKEIPYTICHEPQNVRLLLDPVTVSGKHRLTVRYHGGMAAMLNLPDLHEGMPDEGLRIHRESFDEANGIYTVDVAGAAGKEYHMKLLAKSGIASVAGAEVISLEKDLLILRFNFSKNNNDPFADKKIEISLN